MSIHLSRLVASVSFGFAFFLAYVGPTWATGKEVTSKKPLRMDRYEDPLPEGAVARLGSVRFHHPGGIIAGAFSPDGKTILAVGSGKKGCSLRFSDAASGKELSAFDVERSQVRGVAFAPDGKTVGLCGDRSVQLYDIKSGKPVRTFTSKSGDEQFEIISFAFSPDGKTLAAGCMEWKTNNPIRVWEVETGRELAPFEGQGTSYNAVAFSADGKRLFCGPAGFTSSREGFKPNPAAICVWDVATRKKIRQVASQAYNLAFSPSGNTIAYEDEGIHLVSVVTGQTLCKIEGKHHTFFAFAPDSKTMISLEEGRTEEGRTLTEWDATTGKSIRRFEGHLGDISRLIGYSPDGKRLALKDSGWHQDGSLRIWDVATATEIRPFDGHLSDVIHLAYAPNGKLLASSSGDRTVRLWDPGTGKQVRVLVGHAGGVFAVAFSPDGKTLASSSADGTTQLWEVATGRRLASFENPPGRREGRVYETQASIALSFAADGKTLFAVGSNGMMAAWDWKARKEVQRKVLDKDGTARPVFLPNLRAVLTVSGGLWDFRERSAESLYLWNLATGNAIQEIPLRNNRENGYAIECKALAASTDEKMLVSSQVLVSQTLRGAAYHDPILCLWERVTGKEVLQIKKAMSSAFAFSPDSRLLAADDGGVSFFHGSVGSPSFGSTISLWDTLTGERQATLSGHTAQVRCLAFSPDGKTLASGSADHTILIWNTPSLKVAKANAVKPTAEQLQRWWDDLAGADAAVAHQTGGKLVFSPTSAVSMLRAKLRPASAVDPKKIAPLIKDLDSSQFQVRDQAIRQLEAMEDLAEPALVAALAASPSLEKRRRLESLLEKAAAHSASQMQMLRALTVLERIASPEARQVIESLSRGTLDARITREAQGSLRRVGALTE